MQALQSLNLTLDNTKLHTSSHCEIFESTATIQLEVDLSHTHSILMSSSKSTAEVIHFPTLFKKKKKSPKVQKKNHISVSRAVPFEHFLQKKKTFRDT